MGVMGYLYFDKGHASLWLQDLEGGFLEWLWGLKVQVLC